MSHIPSTAMKHAHTHTEPMPVKRASQTVEHMHPPLWTMVAAGVAGAVATALVFSLRSSSPAKPPKDRRKASSKKKKSG